MNSERWHHTATPCTEYGKPHGSCYTCAVADAADRQGIQALALALRNAGFDVTIQQTGGFCMAVTGRHPHTNGTIVGTSEGIGIYTGTGWDDGDDHQQWHDTTTITNFVQTWRNAYDEGTNIEAQAREVYEQIQADARAGYYDGAEALDRWEVLHEHLDPNEYTAERFPQLDGEQWWEAQIVLQHRIHELLQAQPITDHIH